MNLANETSNTYVLPGYVLPADGEVEVDDERYETDDLLAYRIEQMDEANTVTVTDAPVGYPRSTQKPGGGSSEGGGGGLSEAEVEAIADSSAAEAVNAIVTGAPAALDTLNEIAAALGDDPASLTDLDARVTALESAGGGEQVDGVGDTLALWAATR